MYLLLFLLALMYQCLNGAIPSWKCSIKAPAKWRNSVYVLCQRSKWLGPKCNLMWWLHNIETLRKIYKVYIWKLHIWWSRGVCHQTENSDEFLSKFKWREKQDILKQVRPCHWRFYENPYSWPNFQTLWGGIWQHFLED